MSADAPAENETRVVLDAGEERLVVMANDLFATAGDDFVSSVKAELGSQGSASAQLHFRHPTILNTSALESQPKPRPQPGEPSEEMPMGRVGNDKSRQRGSRAAGSNCSNGRNAEAD